MPWVEARVVATHDETPSAKTLRLALPAPSTHRAGQHYIVRLTAPDGYQASRSYSVASAPDGSNEIELTVERLDNGEVSTFLHDDIGEAAKPYLEEVARDHPNPLVRKRAAAELRRY